MSEEETVVTETPSQELVTPTPEATPEAQPQEIAPQETVTPPVETTPEPQPEPVPERVVPQADGYTLPEGVPTQIAEFANKNDMTQEQLDTSLQFFGKISQGTREAEVQAVRSAGEAHVKNWGEASKANLSIARRALAQNDPEGVLKKTLDSTGFGNHPAVLDFLLNIGKSMQEGGFLKSAVNRTPGQKTAAQSMYGDKHPSVE